VTAGTRPGAAGMRVGRPRLDGLGDKGFQNRPRADSLLDLGVPIIMRSAKCEHPDRVRGLSRGADDYVTKPHSLPQMIPSRSGRRTTANDRES